MSWFLFLSKNQMNWGRGNLKSRYDTKHIPGTWSYHEFTPVTKTLPSSKEALIKKYMKWHSFQMKFQDITFYSIYPWLCGISVRLFMVDWSYQVYKQMKMTLVISLCIQLDQILLSTGQVNMMNLLYAFLTSCRKYLLQLLLLVGIQTGQ